MRGTPRGARSLALLPPWLPPPETIGAVIGDRYRVSHRIAEGTTGVVHGAEDLREGCTVALRLVRPELSATPGLLEFLDARVGGPLAVAGLAELRDVGRTRDGLVYLVSDAIDGEHLGVLLQRRGRMAWSRARPIVRRLAAILGELHRLGGHHGFLQARSCYVVGDGADAAILAPGLDAFLIDASESLLSAATLTICRYAAPERASGDPADHRVDVYALGVILYELLTARLPFEDPNPNRLLAMHMLSPVPPPRQVAPTAAIPEAVEAVILRALAKDPAERWPSMAAMIEAIDACPDAEAAVAAAPAIAPVAAQPAAISPPLGQALAPLLAPPPVTAAIAPPATGEFAPTSSQAEPETARPHREPSGSATAAAVEAALTGAPTAPSVAARIAALPPRGEPTRAPLRLPPLPAIGRPGVSTLGPSLVIPNLVGERSGLSPLADAHEDGAEGPAEAAAVGDGSVAGSLPAAADLSLGTPSAPAPAPIPGVAEDLSSGVGPLEPAPEDMSVQSGEPANDDLHPSASGSMRASASGSRRIVHLIDVRPPGESQSRGRIPASESQSRARVAESEPDAPMVPGHAGEVTMQRAVAAALRGAEMSSAAPAAEMSGAAPATASDEAARVPAAGAPQVEPEAVDPMTISTSSLTRMRRESALSTIVAVTGEDDTLAASGLHSRPSRGVMTWVAAAVAAMVVGTAGFAFLSPLLEEPATIERLDPASDPVVAPTGPSIGPAIAPEAAPIEPEAAPEIAVGPVVAPEPEPPPTALASTSSKKGKAGKAGKAGKRTRDKPRRKREVEVEPEEDDVLEQVRTYMRQKQANEAARAAAAAERPPGALAN